MPDCKRLLFIGVGGMRNGVYFSLVGISRVENQSFFSLVGVTCVNDGICLSLERIGVVS
jgi:hypothetical protein